LRIVVGVDGGRRHAPLEPVHGLADLVQLARELELVGAEPVANGVAAVDRNARVVAPLVGIADLVVMAFSLTSACRLVAGSSTAPSRVLAQRLLERVHHLEGALFAFRAEGALDELPAESFA